MSEDGRARRYAHRRDELLDAVLEHVLDHGLTDLTMRPLAAAVGVSHVTLRHHFGTKEELVAELFDRIRAREPAPAEAGPEGLAGLWRRWTSPEGAREFRLLFEAYGQALARPDQHRRFLDHVVDDRLEAIAGLATAAGCPAAEARTFATLLLAQVRGLQLDLLATGDRERVDGAFGAVLAWLGAEAARWRA